MAEFRNQATLTYSGGVVNSNVVTGNITSVLSATKTAVYDSYRYGDTVTYIVSIINSGATAFTGLTLSDDLGLSSLPTGSVNAPLSYIPDTLTYFVNGQPTAPPTVASVNPLQITNITVPANGNTTIVYSARVNEYAPLSAGSTITNTATISGGGLTESLTPQSTVTVSSSLDLSIQKALASSEVVENGAITYYFTIENRSPVAAVATDNVVITDTFNPIIDIQSVTFEGTPWTLNNQYTYNQATGLFSTANGAITVPAATYTRDEQTGIWSTTPGVVTLKVEGTV